MVASKHNRLSSQPAPRCYEENERKSVLERLDGRKLTMILKKNVVTVFNWNRRLLGLFGIVALCWLGVKKITVGLPVLHVWVWLACAAMVSVTCPETVPHAEQFEGCYLQAAAKPDSVIGSQQPAESSQLLDQDPIIMQCETLLQSLRKASNTQTISRTIRGYETGLQHTESQNRSNTLELHGGLLHLGPWFTATKCCTLVDRLVNRGLNNHAESKIDVIRGRLISIMIIVTQF